MWVVLYNGWLQKCIIPSITWFHMTIKEDHHVAGCSISASLLGSDQSHRLLMPVPEKNTTNMRSKTRCFNQSPFFDMTTPSPHFLREDLFKKATDFKGPQESHLRHVTTTKWRAGVACDPQRLRKIQYKLGNAAILSCAALFWISIASAKWVFFQLAGVKIGGFFFKWLLIGCNSITPIKK